MFTPTARRGDPGCGAINKLVFNQDNTCFSASLNTGFRVYTTAPFGISLRRDFAGGGIGEVAMLFRSEIFAITGGDPSPRFSVNKVIIWDDYKSRCVGELSFRTEVRSVKLRRDRIVVILSQKIFIYDFAFKFVDQIETAVNDGGLCEISQNCAPMILVCLGQMKGQVRVMNYGCKRDKIVTAHDSSVACLALTHDGRFFATASSRGTLVRVFNALDGSLLQEVRRGADKAEIHSLAFSFNAQWLAVSSNKGTVHVFAVKVDSESFSTLTNDRSHIASETNHHNGRLSSLSIFKGVLPKYFSSEWSFAQFRLTEGVQYFVAFGRQKNTIFIIGTDGSFHRCEFDPVNGGEMTQLEKHNFLEDNFLGPGETYPKL